MKRFNLVVCGGTFDHFHKGHREFLKFILSQSEKVVLGLTSDEYVKKKILNQVQNDNKGRLTDSSFESYEQRKQSLQSFLAKENASGRVEIEPIHDVFIPQKWQDLPIEAIVASDETKEGAELINKKREEQKKQTLEVVIAPLVKAQDGEIISSTRIRSGQINRSGKLFVQPKWLQNTLVLPEELRSQLQKPYGGIFTEQTLDLSSFTSTCVITVGDVVSYSFNRLGYKQALSVVDLYVARQKTFESLEDLEFSKDISVIKVENPAGRITKELFGAVWDIVDTLEKPIKQTVLHVIGEEDLAVLPVLLASPLGYVVFYGQPNEGMVRVWVTEENKEKAYELVSKFRQY